MAIVEEKAVWRASRDWQGRILGTEPNLAMPLGLSIMLVDLEVLTRKLEKANEDRARPIPDPGPDQIDIDLQRWRIRLDDYIAKVGAAEPADRQAVLWTVTAPLLLGWVGGPTGSEVALPFNGYPVGFNTEFHHLSDVVTPYRLANQLEIADAFEQQIREDTIREIEERAKEVTKTTLDWLPWVLGGTAVVALGGTALYLGLQARTAKRALLGDAPESAA